MPFFCEFGANKLASIDPKTLKITEYTLPNSETRPRRIAITSDDVQGRIVIDPTNPIILPGFRVADLGGKTSSEVVASYLPGARVVKAFNTLPAGVLAADPHEAGGRRVVFVSGDDADSKASVLALADGLGFATVDLGSLAAGGRMQQFGGPLAALNLVALG